MKKTAALALLILLLLSGCLSLYNMVLLGEISMQAKGGWKASKDEDGTVSIDTGTDAYIAVNQHNNPRKIADIFANLDTAREFVDGVFSGFFGEGAVPVVEICDIGTSIKGFKAEMAGAISDRDSQLLIYGFSNTDHVYTIMLIADKNTFNNLVDDFQVMIKTVTYMDKIYILLLIILGLLVLYLLYYSFWGNWRATLRRVIAFYVTDAYLSQKKARDFLFFYTLELIYTHWEGPFKNRYLKRKESILNQMFLSLERAELDELIMQFTLPSLVICCLLIEGKSIIHRYKKNPQDLYYLIESEVVRQNLAGYCSIETVERGMPTS